MEKEDKAYIPKNVKNELEFFRGFEIKELIITIVVGIPSAIPTFLYTRKYCFLIYIKTSKSKI